MRHPENVCGGGEAELGMVMLAYAVLFFFSKDFFLTVVTGCFSC